MNTTPAASNETAGQFVDRVQAAGTLRAHGWICTYLGSVTVDPETGEWRCDE